MLHLSRSLTENRLTQQNGTTAFRELNSRMYTCTFISHPQIALSLHTWTVAIASTPPEAPSKWPIMDFVELTFNCTKVWVNLEILHMSGSQCSFEHQHTTTIWLSSNPMCKPTRSMAKCHPRAWKHSKPQKVSCRMFLQLKFSWWRWFPPQHSFQRNGWEPCTPANHPLVLKLHGHSHN